LPRRGIGVSTSRRLPIEPLAYGTLEPGPRMPALVVAAPVIHGRCLRSSRLQTCGCKRWNEFFEQQDALYAKFVGRSI
jgi:hypothetical protein